MEPKKTQIQVTVPTRETLIELRKGKDTHDSVISRLIKFYLKGNPQ